MPPTEALLRTIWDVDQTWMPLIRERVAAEEMAGKQVVRIASVTALEAYRAALCR